MDKSRAFLLAAALLVACSEDPEPAPPPPTVDLAAPVPDGQARAGRVGRTEELIGGPQAKGKIGDYKLMNSRVRFIIEDARPSSGYGPYGGGILDADRVRPQGEPGQSHFGELIQAFDLRAVRPTRVEVVNDGLDGKAAQVRVHAVDDEFPLLEAALSDGTTGVARPLGAKITIDYILEPDAEFLKVITAVRNDGEEELRISDSQLGAMFGDGVRQFIEGGGFGDIQGEVGAMFGAASEKSPVSYGFVSPRMQPLLSFLGITLLSMGEMVLPPGREGRVPLYVLVGDGDVASLLAVREKLEGKSLPRLRVTATAGGKPVPGARVHVTGEGGYRALGRSDAEGVATFPLPPGDYQVEAIADGRDSTGPLSVSHTALGSIVQAGMQEAGTFIARTTESGTAIPFKLILFRESGSPKSYPSSYGETRMPAGAHWIEFAGVDGAKLSLAAGKYRAVAQRGFEYDLSETVIDVVPGKTVQHEFKLTRVVDTVGWVSADFHIHAAPSPDSDDVVPYKVLSFGAEGLEVAVSTDHEFIADYEPVVRGLGLERFVKTIIGSEVTTVSYGHFNAFPLKILDAPNNGAVSWYRKSARQIFDEIRRNPGEPMLQMNHPRGGIASGYFSMIGFDRETFTAQNQEDFHTDFDAMEVLNGKRFASSEQEVQLDWFAFLKRGYRVVGTGNSDSHHSLTSEVGTPRTYVKVDTDEPSLLDEAAFIQATREGRATMSAGVFVTFTLNGKGLGELATLEDGKAKLAIKVQSPAWTGAIETLEVLRNGEVVARRTLSATGVVRYEGEIIDEPTADAFYVVRVRSEAGNLGPAAPTTRPYGLTNPIWVDVDGNGKFDPPL